MEIFKVKLGFKEFSVIGVADIAKKTAKFQGLINGIPFVEDEDYQLVREVLFETIALNQPQNNEEKQ